MTARCYAVSPTQAMQPTHYIGSSTLVEGEAKEFGHVFHQSRDQRFTVGIWACSPCKEKIESYPFDEFMVILAGSVTCAADDGEVRSFTAGDCFFMEKGWKGTWHMTAPFKKYFVIHAGD